MLPYSLLDNPVTPDPTDFRGQPISRGAKTDEDLANYMTSRGSTVTKAEALANVQELSEAMFFFLKEGYTINSCLLKASFSISGVFTSEEDTFDPARHQININLRLGNNFKGLTEQIRLTKIEANKILPQPASLLDVNSNTTNERLTPGGTIKLSGKRMKIDPKVSEQGVYLINGTKTVKVTTLVTNRNNELVMVLPATLTKGSYTLEVRAAINGAERSGTLPASLTVV